MPGNLLLSAPEETMDVKKRIATRLKAELVRKDLTPSTLGSEAGLAPGCVDGYLTATREISFDELNPLCATLGVRLMRLLGPSFDVPHLQYRSVSATDRRVASGVEDSFALLAEFLPKPKAIPDTPGISERDTDIQWLMTEVRASVEALRSKFPSAESLYQAAQLQVLPVSAGQDGFDAFLLTMSKRALVCVNRDKPPARIHFSLLHEMAHYLFHKDRDIPLDILADDYYAETIRPEVVPEYVANKFAQQYLIPFDLAESFVARKKLPADLVAFIGERRTTPQVFANAIYDCWRLRQNRPRYLDLLGEVKTAAPSGWGSDRSIMLFVEAAGAETRKWAMEAQEHFSDEVWSGIATAWELGRV